MNYKACDFYVARTPLLPIEDYFRVFESGDPAKISSELFTRFKDPFLEETLAVSSRESYEALHRLEAPDKSRASDQMLSTLLKYYIRLTTRPTPYGLFSGVSLGTFGKENRLVLADVDQAGPGRYGVVVCGHSENRIHPRSADGPAGPVQRLCLPAG